MIEHTEQRVLVFDSTKLDARGLTSICSLDELSAVLTDDAVRFRARHDFDGLLLPNGAGGAAPAS